MWDGYGHVPVTSRAAEAELERQRARRLRAATGGSAGPREGDGDPAEVNRAPSSRLTGLAESPPEKEMDGPS